ncbi:hypothetical protein MPAR168_00505 [Methylorubrum populi]|uniref:Uncharacterized protein n=1 Tax=Methylobacterium radiotolerans TaxID=31998 RepID=A0ABU7T8F6_9HYPH
MTEPTETDRRPVAGWQYHAGVSADEHQALRAVYAAHVNAVGRIEAAMAAGEVCEILGVAHCDRAIRAVQRAVRGQMPAGEAALEVAQAEFEAFGKAALAPEDREIQPALYWLDAVRKPRSQPVDALGAPDAA